MKIRLISAAIIAAVGWVGLARAQTPALHIGMTNGVLDEFGNPLKGTTPGADQFGFTYVVGEVVQVLIATNGIFPPDVDGTPHPQNELISSTKIGLGMDPSEGPRARFNASVPYRPSGKPVFVRVYNKPTLEESSFYGDSEIFPVSETFNYAFTPTILRTDKPMDTNDWDGDGLINSWEKSLASDPNNPDTDGDGMPDGPEFRAGTDVANAASLLVMVELVPAPPHNLDVYWDSVAGKSYLVEYKAGDLTDTNDFFNPASGVVTATGLVARTTITNALNNVGGHYRVKLVEP